MKLSVCLLFAALLATAYATIITSPVSYGYGYGYPSSSLGWGGVNRGYYGGYGDGYIGYGRGLYGNSYYGRGYYGSSYPYSYGSGYNLGGYRYW